MDLCELWEDYNNYYISCEYCEGGELYQRLAKSECGFTNDNSAFIVY